MGDVAGNELTHTAAAVMLGGLVSTTLLNLLILPAVQLTLGPVDPIAVPEADDVPSWAAAESPPMVLR